MNERIQKIISGRGVMSRRGAERLITEGRVTVNGHLAILGESADPGQDDIRIDGVPLPAPSGYVYIMLNKPRGVVTTMHDERGRRTVADLTKDVGQRVYPVGRLDQDSEGLLLLTNDGALTKIMTHPSHEKEKVYRVTVRGDIDSALPVLSEPMTIDGYRIHSAGVKLNTYRPDGGILEITIHEGRNRQIRKMCAQAGLEVRRLVRIAEGGIHLHDVVIGRWRYLTKEELDIINCIKNCKNAGKD
jgi:23S rRNA pseudouridine2605 synthase